MVFVEFVTQDETRVGNIGEKRYFVGKDWPSIAADTKCGTEFGFTKIGNRRMLTEEQIRKIHEEKRFRYLEDGIQKVQAGKCDSYMIA